MQSTFIKFEINKEIDMDTTAKSAKLLGDNSEAVANSPLSSLNLPGRILKLLENGGFSNVGDLALRLEDDPKSILAVGGIGPKALLDIRTAVEELAIGPGEEYREPVQSLGDQFKSVPPAAPKVTMEKADPEKIKEDKKKKDQKPKKASSKKSKKPKKADKKKGKESKMADKKKDKKSKKDDKKKDKKKDKKSGKKKSKK